MNIFLREIFLILSGKLQRRYTGQKLSQEASVKARLHNAAKRITTAKYKSAVTSKQEVNRVSSNDDEHNELDNSNPNDDDKERLVKMAEIGLELSSGAHEFFSVGIWEKGENVAKKLEHFKDLLRQIESFS